MSQDRRWEDDDGDDIDSFLEATGLGDPEGEPVWRREWQNMPEFVQDKQVAYATIVVRFNSQEDLDDFAARIGQKLNAKTKSIWHPYKSHWGGPGTDKRYVDES